MNTPAPPNMDALWPISPTPDHTTLTIAAETAHEAVRSYMLALGKEPSAPWGLLSDEAHHGIIMAAVSVTQGASPETLHLRWMAHATRAGWVYGEAFDRAKQTRPDLRPWAELTHAEQANDRLFARVAHAVCLALAPAP